MPINCLPGQLFVVIIVKVVYMNRLIFSFLTIFCCIQIQAQEELPDTGISGIYEVVHAVDDGDYAIRYFNEYGFTVVDSASLSKDQAEKLYGVPSALKTYRMQNGPVDCHGLIRIWVWENSLGPGVGYGPAETIGSRMSVMMTGDIMRLYDVYMAARESKEKWLPTEPISDDLFGLNKETKNSVLTRPVLVRENAVYGEFFNHVFFQRSGYQIPGYGYINPDAPLKTSEFTHHDWIIKAPSMASIDYLGSALGLKAEGAPSISGDWQKGPKRVFMMEDGYSHIYQGFVSPNNICGKLKFFIPQGSKPDRSDRQRLGELGTTMHSLYTAKLDMVYENVKKDNRLTASPIMKNELGERCFNFKDEVGIQWQIIEKFSTQFKPVTSVEFTLTND